MHERAEVYFAYHKFPVFWKSLPTLMSNIRHIVAILYKPIVCCQEGKLNKSLCLIHLNTILQPGYFSWDTGAPAFRLVFSMAEICFIVGRRHWAREPCRFHRCHCRPWHEWHNEMSANQLAQLVKWRKRRVRRSLLLHVCNPDAFSARVHRCDVSVSKCSIQFRGISRMKYWYSLGCFQYSASLYVY